MHQESLLSYTPPTAHPDDANFSDTRTCELEIRAGRNGLDALVLVGEKLNEPVHWQGPFVQADEGENNSICCLALDEKPCSCYTVKVIHEHTACFKILFNYISQSTDGLRRSAERFGSLPGSAYWEHTLTDANWRKRLQELHLKERLS